MNSVTGRFVNRIGVLVGVTLLAVSGLSQSQQQDDAEKARLKKLDSGPKTIDVAKYPDELRSGYAAFQKKCVKCHSLARAINTSFVLPGEWQRYIKRMVYKPDSKMTEDDGKAIYRFLAYDSSVRKADSLRVHLARLSPGARAEAIEKIKALNPAFTPGGK